MLESTPSKRKKPTSVGEYKKLSTQIKCAADAARNRAETYIGGAQWCTSKKNSGQNSGLKCHFRLEPWNGENVVKIIKPKKESDLSRFCLRVLNTTQKRN